MVLTLPEELRAALAQADEDYLVGLSNRGTVNRAKKDLGALALEAEIQDGEVLVMTGGERCIIRAPLGDSGCTCPSPGMCRHRIAAVLWLQSQAAEGDAGDAEPSAPDLTALLEVPVEQLRRAMGSRAFHDLVFRLGREGLPDMEEGSTVRVEMPWESAAVKLLVPLEHATCTCRSQELCRHKAAALLCWQVKKGKHRLEELAGGLQPEASRWDREQISAAAQAVRELTGGLLDTGLTRLSAAAPDSAQRLAALCHTAGLPRLESGLRALFTLLERALDRSAAFRTEDLLLRLAGLDHLAQQLAEAEGEEALRELAGTFREEYLACPTLSIYLMGERQFCADSGYAGTIYYFWETGGRQWYTYTVALPTFYEKRTRRSGARDPAPWGLECMMDQLYGLRVTLERGKATRDRRLSSSEVSRAVIGERLQPWEVLPQEICWEDFTAMFQALEPRLLEGAETDRVVLVRPCGCAPQKFDRTDQLFRLLLRDRAGHALPVEVRYRAEEKALIQALEALVRQLGEKPPPAFLGLLRLEGEGLILYPVEYYFEWGDDA